MALAVDELDGHLDFHKIPVIDLRYLSQDEINCAAQCSDEYSDLRFDDIVIPKIDRSIFNESAGSRKQTYSRLRFSQRKEQQQIGGVTRRRAGLLSVSRPSIGGGRSPSENSYDLKDNNQILQLLRQLFMKGECPSVCKRNGDQIENDVLPLQLSHIPSLDSASGSNPSSSSTHDLDSNAKHLEEKPREGDCLQLAESYPAIQETQNERPNKMVGYKVFNDSRIIPDAQEAQSTPSLEMVRNNDIVDEHKVFDDATIIPDAQMTRSMPSLETNRNKASVDEHKVCDDARIIPDTKEDQLTPSLETTRNSVILDECNVFDDATILPDAQMAQSMPSMGTDRNKVIVDGHKVCDDASIIPHPQKPQSTLSLEMDRNKAIVDENKVSDDARIIPDAQMPQSMPSLEMERNTGLVDEHKVCHDARIVADAQMRESMASLEMDRSKVIVDESLDRPKKKMRTKEDARRKGQAIAAQEQMGLKILGVTQDGIVADCSSIDTKTTARVQHEKAGDDSKCTDETVARYMREKYVNNCSQSDQKSADMNNSMTQSSADNSDVQHSSTQETFMPQLKRKFHSLDTEAEVHGFFEKVGGEWASKRKKRKIVDAEEVGQGFPKGWKLLLGVRKKDSRFIIECRKYISPDGPQFASCREVSAYLHSTSGLYPTVGASEAPSCQSAENAQDYLTQKSNLPGNSPSINGFALHSNEGKQESQRNTCTSTTAMVEDNSKKGHDVPILNTPVNCLKCDITFSNRNTPKAHMTVNHSQKEKKTSIAKSSIADGVIMVDGKYECQVCHKVFNERHRYNGHVGVHVRNAKRPQSSLGEISNASGTSDSHLHEICENKFTEDTNIDAIVTSDSTNCNQQEQNAHPFSGAVPESSPSGENVIESSHDAQLLGAFDATSVKDELDYNSGNLKTDTLTGFEHFQMEYMPKFSFETSQDMNSEIGAPMELGLETSVLQQEMDPPGQFEWEAVLAKIENSRQHFVCVWCNSEFSHEGFDSELQADSVGFICPVCKTKMGQVNI